MSKFNAVRICLALGTSLLLGLTITPASAGVLGMSDEAIYADALWGAAGNTINTVTGSVDDWIQDPPDGGTDTDLKWDHNIAAWNGGLTAAGEAGGTSLYSSEDPNGATPAYVLRTTASGLNSALKYNVYLTYYDIGGGVNAAITGNSLNNYLSNYNIDTGVPNTQGVGAKLALLGEVSGVTEVSIDVGGAGGSYWDGLLVDVVPPGLLDGFAAGSIYADASYGVGGNTINSGTLSVDDWILEIPLGDADDGLWDNNDPAYGWNGGLDANGDPGGTSLYSNDAADNFPGDDPTNTDAPVITTTATGLVPTETYNVYLTYYDTVDGVQAALSGDPLVTYVDNNWNIDTGIEGYPGSNTVKLALLGQVTGVSEVGIDVGSTIGAYYEGLLVEHFFILTWDTTNNNWADVPGGDSHWEGGALDQIPTLVDLVEIHSGTATVAAPGAAAKTLTATGGGVIIDTGQTLTIAQTLEMQSGSTMTVRDGATLDVGGNVDMQPTSSLTLSGAATLDVGGGTIAQMDIGGVAPADVTVTTEGTLDIDGFDNQGIAGTFTKSGIGTLSMINSPDGTVVAAGTTLKVTEGTLSLGGTDPLGGSTSVEMAGGTLSIGAPESILDLFEPGVIYADASYGPVGNTVDSVTGDHSSWVQDPPSGAVDDLKWDHNTADWNGGLDADGKVGGTSWYSSDDPLGGTPAPVIKTTASGLNPAETYDVYLTYYNNTVEGVRAAISDDPGGLQTYAVDDWDVDTGIEAWPFSGTVKLASLGQVTSETSVAIDVGSTGASYYEGLLVGTLETFDLTTTQIAVTADSTITTPMARLDLGPLSLQAGVLTTAGASDRITFTDTTIPGGAVGFDTATNTEPGAITANGATIIKRGEADLIVDTPGDLTGATFDVQAGRLVAQHGSNPIAGATVQLTGGRLLLAAKPAAGSPVTYDNQVIVDAPGTIIAGAGDTGTSGVEVILGGTNGLTVNSSVGLASTDAYTLNVAGTIDAAAGAMVIEQGTVEISGAANQIQQLTVDAGTLNLTGTANQIQQLTVDGGQANLPSGGTVGELRVNAGALNTAGADLTVDRLTLAEGVTAGTGTSNHITVGETFSYGSAAAFSVSPADSIQVSGESLSDAMEIGLSGGTIQLVGTGGGVEVPYPEGLVAQWRFEDASDLGYDTVTPLRTSTAYGNPQQEIIGKFGRALRLDGSNRLEVDSTGIDGIYSISGWMNLEAVTFWASALWGQWGNEYWAGYGTDEGADHGSGVEPHFADWSGYDTGGGWNITSALPLDGSIEADRWYHVVSVRDGLDAQLWIDGAMVAAGPAGPAIDPAGRLLVIGNSNGLANPFTGLIDELYVYDSFLFPDEIATLYNPTVTPGELQLTQASLTVSADTTLELNTGPDAELGDLTVAGGVTFSAINDGGGGMSVGNASLGSDSQLTVTKLVVRDTLEIGSSPGTVTILGTLELAPTATLNVEISEDLHDKVIIDGGLGPPVFIDYGNMHGTLAVTGLKPMRYDDPGDNPDEGLLVVYGDKVLTIGEMANPGTENGFDPAYQFTAGVPRSYGAEAFSLGLTGSDIVPNLGDPLGPDVYIPSLDANVPDNAGLWFGNASDASPLEDGVYWDWLKIDIGVFQAAPGDTDGNRKVEGPDILRILTASQFGDGPQLDGNGDSIVVWGTGDFDGNHKVEGPDILLLLRESLFGDGRYSDKGPVVFPAPVAGGDVKLVVTEDGLVIDAGGAKINGYMLKSEAGILTGDDANNIGLFQEDTDDRITGAFAVTLKGEHALGDVIGQTDVDLTGDLTLTYTLVGQPGLFTASIVVPEPGTLMLLLSGLIGLLIWRRKK